MKKTYIILSFYNFLYLVKTNIYLFIFISFISCSKNESQTTIRGNISNLPDGTMYLCKDYNTNKIDSTETKGGKFELNYELKNDEPFYFTLHHIDKNNTFRIISFSTSAKYNNSGYNTSVLMSDSIVVINDTLTDNSPIGFSSDFKTKFVNINEISAGYQTNALLHTDGDLFAKINKDTYGKVLNKIKEYPNSYHLLYQIENNKNSFSVIQIQKLLSSFKGEITKSETIKKLNSYNNKRIDTNKLLLPLLINEKGVKTKILNSNYKKHLVIFWASWCGPCRQEIPSLKTMYSKYKLDIEFVSISIDDKNEAWQKALIKESMPWKQLIVSEKSKEYEPIEIFFQLSNSIPQTVLLDNNMKVLKARVGQMNEDELNVFLQD